MFNSIEFDDYVVAGLGNRTSDNDQWPAELPADVRSQVVAIVQAPNWDELPRSAIVHTPSMPTNAEILTGQSLILGIGTVAAILCAIFFGFIFQSAAVVYLCLTVAAFSLGATIFLQSRAKGFAAAFGKAPSMDGTLTRADFVRFQKGIAETCRITGVVLAITLAVLIILVLYKIDDRYFGGQDSVAAATIRAGTIFTIPTVIWIAWYSLGKKRGAVYTVVRYLRGFVARNLSPLWVSWLYEAKRKPKWIEVVQPTDRTMKQVLENNWPLLALFLICIVYLANTGWLEGHYNVEDVPRHRRGKAHWVNYVVQWLFHHPTSTLFVAAPLGSLSVAVFAYRLLKLVNPKFAGAIAITLFFVSILLFAARGAA